MGEHLLELKDVRSQLALRSGLVRAVDGVSFHVDAGETLGIVGESGSGKSMTALSIMRLLPPTGRIVEGEIRFKGQDLARLSEEEMDGIRGSEMAMIFQDPMTSLNPVYRTGWQVGEPLRIHRGADLKGSIRAAVDLFGQVGIPEPEHRAGLFPHVFSGGMRQRAMIAMGLTTAPSLLIADEPTTALDVTIQAQILELLRGLSSESAMATILITHNLGVVAGMCDRVVVMYAGRVVEQGPTEEVFARPEHPYTWSLLRSIPRVDADRHEALKPIDGLPPDLARLPDGCKFHPRCPFAYERCLAEEPALLPIRDGRLSRCWVTQEGGSLEASGHRA
jgi:oligopeptide/dipeptide ABC transporter ATP-binding protein